MQSRWHDPLWRLLAALEEELGCNVGSNAYLTPAGSQGFAPHWYVVVLRAAGNVGGCCLHIWKLCNPMLVRSLPQE